MEKLTYKDYCGTYRLIQHRDGTVTVLHTYHGQNFNVGKYKSLKGAKIGLAKYCGGMPEKVNK